MARTERFTLRVDKDEKMMIAFLSQWLERSGSDAIRLVIREAFKGLDANDNAHSLDGAIHGGGSK